MKQVDDALQPTVAGVAPPNFAVVAFRSLAIALLPWLRPKACGGRKLNGRVCQCVCATWLHLKFLLTITCSSFLNEAGHDVGVQGS